MRKSSGIGEGIEGLAALDRGPEHGHSPAREGDECLRVVLSLAPLAVVERLGQGIFRADGTERALEESRLRALSPPKVLRQPDFFPDCRITGARPAAAANASADRKRLMSPTQEMNSATSTAPIPGRDWMRALSGWAARSAARS